MLWASRGPCWRRDWRTVSPKSSVCVCVTVYVCCSLYLQSRWYKEPCVEQWCDVWICLGRGCQLCVCVCSYWRGSGGMGKDCRERDEFGERTVREGVTWSLFGLDPRQRGPVYGARVHPSLWCPVQMIVLLWVTCDPAVWFLNISDSISDMQGNSLNMLCCSDWWSWWFVFANVITLKVQARMKSDLRSVLRYACVK